MLLIDNLYSFCSFVVTIIHGLDAVVKTSVKKRLRPLLILYVAYVWSCCLVAMPIFIDFSTD